MLDVKYADYLAAKVEKPKQFDEMLEIAKKTIQRVPICESRFL